ncbi:MAG: hypothetical protein V3W26_05455 [Thermodesulfobacteriota bacterium]
MLGTTRDSGDSGKGEDDEIPSLKELYKEEVPVERIIEVLRGRYGDGVLKNKKKGHIRRDLGIYLTKSFSGKKDFEIHWDIWEKDVAMSLSLKCVEEAV